jgi:hypothetical protein
MPASNPFDDFDDEFSSPSSSGSSESESKPHEHDYWCGHGENCFLGKSESSAGHVPDRAGHQGRRVRARVADFIGGGDSYAGPKEEKPSKAPLRDRIASKIATKPKDEGASGGGSVTPAESLAGRSEQPQHYHGFDCSDPKTCTVPGVGDEF